MSPEQFDKAIDMMNNRLRDCSLTVKTLIVCGNVMRTALQRALDGKDTTLPLFAMDRWDEAVEQSKVRPLQTTVSGDIPETKS